ncbi:GNAT family N-acetyltransferase [Tissierella sp. Yu-01]|jgi:GNAT superfamily N-acetyltransferase|uniref:GNAT family N-acetyltransferase n=1 Tax=Tissierella sp. Yu-01 TaxID=3035694 RepID=UPI00240DF0A9|nr:GNAT family N-acetyltransferase [Tissierella sp. Yu-01]WFA08871.1 GNAT family N-acetyltransferase [Tissierella sp. Yu-01]
MFEIKEINPELTYEIRHIVLRPHQTIRDCMYETDLEVGGFHIGAFYNGKLISVVSFCIQNNSEFSSEKQYRLRAMATLPEFRKLGAGRELVNYGESIIKARDYDILWCNGRTTAQEYYERLGFKPYGSIFGYPPTGPHIVMYKRLR